MSTPNRLTALRNPCYYSPEHETFRQTVRSFATREIAPHADQWDEEGGFPMTLYRAASRAGIAWTRRQFSSSMISRILIRSSHVPSV